MMGTGQTLIREDYSVSNAYRNSVWLHLFPGSNSGGNPAELLFVRMTIN